MAGIGIIANPHANLNRRNPERPKLLSYIAGEQGLTAITQDLDELYEAMQKFYARDIEVLAINGGDGTISRTLTTAIRIFKDRPLPKIAILRGGTMNMLADNLGIRGSPHVLLARLLEGHASNQLRFGHLPTLQIEDNYGFLFANGTSANFLKKFYQRKNGAIGALNLVLRLCVQILSGRQSEHGPIVRSYTSKLQIDDRRELEVEYLSLLCSTVNCLPLRIPFFNGLDSDHRAQSVAVSFTEREIAYKLPLLLAGKGRELNFELREHFDRVGITSTEGMTYTLDGELYEQKEHSKLVVRHGPELTTILL